MFVNFVLNFRSINFLWSLKGLMILLGGWNVILLNEIAKTSTSIYGTLKKKKFGEGRGGGDSSPMPMNSYIAKIMIFGMEK